MRPIITEYRDWYNIGEAVVLFALMTTVGIWAGLADKTEDAFFVGRRAITQWLLAFTISAGVIGGGVLLVFAEYVFRYGVSAFCIVGGIIVGTLLMIPIATKFKPLADRQLFYTLPDLYAYEWGRTSGVLATGVVGLWTIGFIIMQLISAGEILEWMTGSPYWLGIVLSSAVVASYLLLSGFRAVVITDVLQYIALIALLLIICVMGAKRVDLPHALSVAVTQQPLEYGQAIGFFVLGALNMIVSADLWQRFYAAKSTTHARRGLVYAAAMVTLAGVLLFIPPLVARVLTPSVPANRALIESLNILLPKWLLGFGLVGILSTVIATLDTMVFIFGISVGHDMRVQQFGWTVDDRLKSTRIAIIAALVVGSLLSILYRQLLALGLSLSTLGLVLAPSLLARLTPWKPPPAAVAVGIVFGLITATMLIVGGVFVPGLLTPEHTLAALGASVIGTMIGWVWSVYKGV